MNYMYNITNFGILFFLQIYNILTSTDNNHK